MALSGDQKALLRLLAQREQGYEDIASLMGLSVDEVRARVKEALDAVEREGGEAPPLPPEPAKSPEPKPAPAAKAPDFPPPAPAAKKPGRGSLPKERRVYAIAAGLGAVVLVIVLLATGAIGGGDSGSDSSPSPSADSGGETQPPAAGSAEAKLANSKLTGAVLRPVDGDGDAAGAALFGKAKKEVLLQVEATGLEPSPEGSAYTIWLYKSPQLALRVGAVNVGKSGGIRVQLPLPEELLGYVASGVFDQIDISLTSNAEYKAEVAAAREEKRLPTYVGTDVLRGPIKGPVAEVAEKSGG